MNGVVFVTAFCADFFIPYLHAIEEVGIDIATIFVGQDIFAVVCHRIVVGFLRVVLFEELREAESFGCDGLVELEIERSLL